MRPLYQSPQCLQASGFAAATALGLIVLSAMSVSAQTGTPSPPTTPPGTWSAQTQPAPQSNTSAVALTAFLTDDGQPIDQGIVWHIFRDRPSADSQPRPLQTVRDPVARIRLEPGAYFVTATFGRAYLTRKIMIDANKPTQEKFVLNAGGLKVNAVISAADATADRSIVYDVFLEERDQAGNRVKVVSAAKTGRIVRLNSGLYQIVSQYGDANARVRTTVAVEPGKLTEATLTHAAAKISFRLVTRVGGDALTDVTWNIQSPQGELVKETAGAVPTHILAAGAYVVIAKHQGRTFRAEFAASAGEANVVEVVAR
ncbi:MAG: hypothetical protein ABL898_16890 [Hyphomicrobiaceae bacterium]